MQTEDRNPASERLDELSTLEILRLIHGEDRKAVRAVGQALPLLAEGIEAIGQRLEAGGNLFYVGAGTSGRLGVLDAAECPPTFGIPPQRVQAILAGGELALRQAVEGAEDDPRQGARDIEKRGVGPGDAVVGLSASGKTPYTLGALQRAGELGALTMSITCNRNTPLSRLSDYPVEIPTGPEILTGSTRMKAGTAQKMVLHMISTALMVRLGYVYGNLMVNVQPTSQKLFRRACSIVAELTGCSPQEAARAVEACRDTRAAILMLRLGCPAPEALRLLAREPNLRRLLAQSRPNKSDDQE